MTIQRMLLFTPGAIPGIPGTYAPGVYDVDYDARTATFVPDLATAQQVDPNATQPLPDPSTQQQQPTQ